jgi:hypothetical protein
MAALDHLRSRFRIHGPYYVEDETWSAELFLRATGTLAEKHGGEHQRAPPPLPAHAHRLCPEDRGCSGPPLNPSKDKENPATLTRPVTAFLNCLRRAMLLIKSAIREDERGMDQRL